MRAGRTCPWLFVAAMLFFAIPGKSDTLAVDFSSTPTSFGGNAWNLGYEFQVVNPVLVTGLGAYNSPDAGWGGTQNVGLWDQNGNLIASAMVTNSDTLIGDWYFVSLTTPVLLTVGQDYVVGAQGGTNYTGQTPISVDPDITYIEDEFFSFGTASPLTPLTEPNSTESLTSASFAGWFGGNLELTEAPEPATFVLLGAGLLGLGLCRKRRTQKSA